MARTPRQYRHQVSQDERAPVQWFVGIDWGTQQHQVCVLDHTRQCVGTRTVEHGGASLAQLATWLTDLAAGHPACVAVAVAACEQDDMGLQTATLVDQRSLQTRTPLG